MPPDVLADFYKINSSGSAQILFRKD